VHDDPPTLPGMFSLESDAPGEPSFSPAPLGWAPTWPAAAERRPPSAPEHTNATLLGISLGANVGLVVVLIGLLVLGHAGFLSPGSTTGGTPPSSLTPHAALSSATPSPTASPTSVSGSLQVAPSQVQLGCGNGQQLQFAVLANTGSNDAQWQAQLSLPTNQAGISISPHRGTLRAGTSTVLQIQNQFNSGSGGQQGAISFVLTDGSADSPPTLSYTTAACS
jgi:hypothetical protein